MSDTILQLLLITQNADIHFQKVANQLATHNLTTVIQEVNYWCYLTSFKISLQPILRLPDRQQHKCI